MYEFRRFVKLVGRHSSGREYGSWKKWAPKEKIRWCCRRVRVVANNNIRTRFKSDGRKPRKITLLLEKFGNGKNRKFFELCSRHSRPKNDQEIQSRKYSKLSTRKKRWKLWLWELKGWQRIWKKVVEDEIEKWIKVNISLSLFPKFTAPMKKDHLCCVLSFKNFAQVTHSSLNLQGSQTTQFLKQHI